jgi:aldehyde dehydrogenase (NAD+)
VDEAQLHRILSLIDKGRKEGAKLLTGGKRWGNRGYYVEPTVFADVTDEMTIAKEEIFGPVMSLLKFKTIDEVIQRANNTSYGLGAGVVTRDIEKALKVSNEVRAGTVYVNCYDVIETNTPFGGYKNSGIGRELADDGLFNYLEQKTVIIRQSTDTLP